MDATHSKKATCREKMLPIILYTAQFPSQYDLCSYFKTYLLNTKVTCFFKHITDILYTDKHNKFIKSYIPCLKHILNLNIYIYLEKINFHILWHLKQTDKHIKFIKTTPWKLWKYLRLEALCLTLYCVPLQLPGCQKWDLNHNSW